VKAFPALAALALAAIPAAEPARAADPPVPSGQDPGGTAVAIITSGIDYTRPQIAGELARDGEGEIIGWDFVDDDARPYVAETDLYDMTMLTALAGPGIRIVPVRVSYADPLWLAKAATFAARTPASVVVTPLVAIDAELEQLKASANRLATLHFIVVPAGEANSNRVEAAVAGLANITVLGNAACGKPEAAGPAHNTIKLLCAVR
jgi:hypothetical protein